MYRNNDNHLIAIVNKMTHRAPLFSWQMSAFYFYISKMLFNILNADYLFDCEDMFWNKLYFL